MQVHGGSLDSLDISSLMSFISTDPERMEISGGYPGEQLLQMFTIAKVTSMYIALLGNKYFCILNDCMSIFLIMQKSIFTGSFPADPVLVHRAWICCSSYLYQTLLLPARRAGRNLAVVRPLVATGQEAQQRFGCGSD